MEKVVPACRTSTTMFHDLASNLQRTTSGAVTVADHRRAVAALTITADMSAPACAATASFRTSIIGTRRTIPKAVQPDKENNSRSADACKIPFAKFFMTHIIP